MKRLTVIVGPVHASKTTYAVQIARRQARLKRHVALIRPSQSVRAHERPGRLVTKNGLEFPAREVDAAVLIETVLDPQTQILWIDEPMLWPDEALIFDVVQRVRQHAAVIVSGLSATSELEPFGQSMPRLLAVADKIVSLRADCDHCGRFNAATRSHCRTPKIGQVLVGGEERYAALCSKCWSSMMIQAAKTDL